MNAILKTTQPIDTTAGIARGAVLVDLSFSQWTARKKNKAVSAKVVASEGAGSTNAAAVYNALLADCKELEAIGRLVSEVRRKHAALTLPWSDSGTRLLPTPMLERYNDFIIEARDEFDSLVTTFLDRYDVHVAAAAFKLGAMFDRSNYPPREEVRHKFGMRADFTPVPLAGDFRVDVSSAVMQDMADKYEQAMQDRIAGATQDLWDRLHEHLERMAERLEIGADGKPNVFKDTLVTGAEELVDLMKHLNPLGDPKIERARLALADAIRGKSADQLRKDLHTREATKDKVQAMLAEFDFGL